MMWCDWCGCMCLRVASFVLIKQCHKYPLATSRLWINNADCRQQTRRKKEKKCHSLRSIATSLRARQRHIELVARGGVEYCASPGHLEQLRENVDKMMDHWLVHGNIIFSWLIQCRSFNKPTLCVCVPWNVQMNRNEWLILIMKAICNYENCDRNKYGDGMRGDKLILSVICLCTSDTHVMS